MQCCIGFFKYGILTLIIGVFSGCASFSNNNAYDPRDPLETTNRTIFKFNDVVDKAVLKPLAVGYENVIPETIRRGISNFFGNLSDLVTTLQHFLQLDFEKSTSSASRFLINSTVGILGFGDVASGMGIPKTNEDFGQTFGTYGVGPGAYLVLPFFGPSTVRDGVGKVMDILVDPIQTSIDDDTARLVGNSLRVVETRASLLSAEQAFEALAFDRYLGVKNAYLANRKVQIDEN
jgi:phospholipid-binding lipoprotein MlaA